jgi:hypothetical protein
MIPTPWRARCRAFLPRPRLPPVIRAMRGEVLLEEVAAFMWLRKSLREAMQGMLQDHGAQYIEKENE